MAVDPDLPLFESPGRRFIAFRPLIRAVGLAGDPRKLVLALAGLVALVVGWSLIDRAFGIVKSVAGDLDPGATIGFFELPFDRRWGKAARLVLEPGLVVVRPFARLFARNVGVGLWGWALAKGLWALTVWGLVGGAIARVTAVQVAAGQGVGVATAARFALRRWLALIGAPLTPFLAVGVVAAGTAAFGLLYRLPGGIGATVAGFLGFVPLLAGVLLALILLGLALGWPLMVATVAAEGEDVADALSRSYSYVNQRTIRYLANLLTAGLLGVLGLVAVLFFARVVLDLGGWGVGLGAPAGWDPRTGGATLPGSKVQFRDFWVGAVSWVAHAYLYSYFWSTITVIYLVLRQDVDGTDPHDVFLLEQAADTFAGPMPASPAAGPGAGPGLDQAGPGSMGDSPSSIVKGA